MAWYQSDVNYIPPEPYVPPTWADGTDEEIAEALEKHYNDEVDLTEYWSVGDERIVQLSSINSFVGSNTRLEAQYAQRVIFVILNVGGKELVTPINNHTECAFIVGQKKSLSTAGKMGNTTAGWSSSDRRTWCNELYYNALPSELKSIFKQHNNYVSNNYRATVATLSKDYFCLPSEKEILGTCSNANSNAEANNTQLEYYKISANRRKQMTDINNSSNYSYWTSSKVYYSGTSSSAQQKMCYISSQGASGAGTVNDERGIAPQGVI